MRMKYLKIMCCFFILYYFVCRKIRGKYESDFRESLYGRHGPYNLLLLAIKYSWLPIATMFVQHGFNINKFQIHDILKNIKSNLGCINDEAKTLVNCILEAGYQFRAKDHCLLEDLICEDNHGYDEELISELLLKSCDPPSLTQVCRTAIRSHLRVVHKQRSVLFAIRKLCLPKTLVQYLCMDEFDCPNQSRVEDRKIFTDNLREPLYFATPRSRRKQRRHIYLDFWMASCFCSK